MAVETERGVTQEPFVRHYRGATRSDVEAAYRNEAVQAAEAGYLPVTHQWTTDWQGFLLAVTFRLSIVATHPVSQTPGVPLTQSQASTAVAPSVPARDMTPKPVLDEFALSQPTTGDAPYAGFAPRDAMTTASPPSPPTAEQPVDEYAPPTASMEPVEPMATLAQPLASQADVSESPTTQAQPADDRWLLQIDQHETYEQVATATPVSAPAELPDAPVEPMPAEPEPATPARVSDDGAPVQARQTRLTVQTMDLHSGGEPLRIIRSGFPDVPNLPALERRRWVMQNADHIRRAIIQEPRGHRDMYGAILLPPNSDHADMTVLFMHNEGYSTMCGHGIIAITTGLIEEGLFPAIEPVTTIRYEVPAGIVTANAATVQLENGDWAVQGVRFTNVPSYLAAQSLSVRPDGVELHGTAAEYGALSVDLAFGGAYYGIVSAAELGLRVVPGLADALRQAGAAITDMLRRDHTPSHPTDPALGFVYGTIIVDLDPRSSPDGRATNAHMRNVTIFADAELDRSPCGSGTSAILAQLHARGRIKVGQEIVNAGITGEHFLGRVEAETALGPYPAVSTSIAGTAYTTGFSTFIVDSRDPLGEGFLLR